MANPLKDKLLDRLKALQAKRDEQAVLFQAQLAQIDAQITALRTLGQNWDTLSIEQGLAELEKTGIFFDLKS